MGFYNIIIKFRFWLSLIAIFGAAILQITDLANFWPVFPLYFLGVIGLLSHIFIGPLRLVQAPMEAGDIEEVELALEFELEDRIDHAHAAVELDVEQEDVNDCLPPN